MAELCLASRGLSKRLGGRTVVDAVGIEARGGELVGVLGPNGAGKTTFLRMLIGLIRPDAGQVSLRVGQQTTDLTGLPVHARARLGLGYLSQTPGAFAGLTVLDNIRVALQLRRLSPDGAGPALERLGLLELQGRRAGLLSGGERRRLELARLCAAAPRVALLDEPLKGLDAGAVESVKEMLQQWAHAGCAVLLADHALGHVAELCTRVCLLEHGRVVSEGAPAEVLRPPGLAAAG